MCEGEIPLYYMMCPLCNGLDSLQTNCPDCRSPLVDSGRRQDYAGPYSPYGSEDQYESSSDQPQSQSSCEHIVECPQCHSIYLYQVPARINPGPL